MPRPRCLVAETGRHLGEAHAGVAEDLEHPLVYARPDAPTLIAGIDTVVADLAGESLTIQVEAGHADDGAAELGDSVRY
jgi:hypothetical protein